MEAFDGIIRHTITSDPGEKSAFTLLQELKRSLDEVIQTGDLKKVQAFSDLIQGNINPLVAGIFTDNSNAPEVFHVEPVDQAKAKPKPVKLPKHDA